MENTSEHLAQRIAAGAVAGLIGTLFLQALRSGSQKVVPGAEAPIRRDPGKFMVEKAESALPPATQEAIPEEVEKAVGKALGVGYGMSFGALYALLRGGPGPVLRDGVFLGMGSWAAGYLGWLPATGLMPPVWKHETKQLWLPLLEHAAYGVATLTGYHCMERLGVLKKP